MTYEEEKEILRGNFSSCNTPKKTIEAIKFLIAKYNMNEYVKLDVMHRIQGNEEFLEYLHTQLMFIVRVALSNRGVVGV